MSQAPPAVQSSSTQAAASLAPWLLIALLAHTGWGVYPVLARYLQVESGIPSLALLTMGYMPLAIAFVLYGVRREGRAIARSRALWIFAAIVVVRSITNVLAARYTLAVYVQLMTLMTPFLVALLSLIALREPLPRGAWAAIGFTFLGSLLMLSSNLSMAGLRFSLTRSDLFGLALALGSAVFLALYMLAVRRTMTSEVSGLGVLLFQSIVIVTVSATLSLLLGEDWSAWGALNRTDWAVFGLYMLVVVLWANGLQIASLRKLGAPTVSSLMGWRLVSTLVVGMLLLGEGLHGWAQVLGMGIVLATVTWFVRQQR